MINNVTRSIEREAASLASFDNNNKDLDFYFSGAFSNIGIDYRQLHTIQ